MGKVYRMNRKAVQRIKARDIVPGDIVEVAGELASSLTETRWSLGLLSSSCHRHEPRHAHMRLAAIHESGNSAGISQTRLHKHFVCAGTGAAVQSVNMHDSA